MDPATRRLAIFAGAIGGSLLLLVGVWSFTGHRHSGVPVIEADPRPLRVKPANPGGLQVEGANDPILSGEQDSKEAMAPPPETPAPQALKAQEQAAATPPPEAAPATIAPKIAAPAAPPAAAAPPPPVEKSAPALRAPRIAAAPMTEPAPTPRPQRPSLAARQETLPPARPAAIAAPQAAATGARAAAGPAVVQLAALDSEERARQEWERVSHRYGELLAGHAPSISRVEHAGKTFWRLRTGGFADAAQATMFCERVKAKGGGCAVASF
jgi:hypothetical protein